jgi:hypothetical protein
VSSSLHSIYSPSRFRVATMDPLLTLSVLHVDLRSSSSACSCCNKPTCLAASPRCCSSTCLLILVLRTSYRLCIQAPQAMVDVFVSARLCILVSVSLSVQVSVSSG